MDLGSQACLQLLCTKMSHLCFISNSHFRSEWKIISMNTWKKTEEQSKVKFLSPSVPILFIILTTSFKFTCKGQNCLCLLWEVTFSICSKQKVLNNVSETGCGKSRLLNFYLKLDTSMVTWWLSSGCVELLLLVWLQQEHKQKKCAFGSEPSGLLLPFWWFGILCQKNSVIMFYKAHEQTLNTDISAGLPKKILEKLANLRIIILCATIDA